MDSIDMGPAMEASSARDHTKRVEARVQKLEAQVAHMTNMMGSIIRAYEAGLAAKRADLQDGEE